MEKKRKKILTGVLNIYIVIGTVLLVISILAIAYPLLPEITYKLYPNGTSNELDSLTSDVIESDVKDALIISEEELKEPTENTQPEIDETLPIAPQLLIENIGVNSRIYEGENPNTALSEGPWMVPNFGVPDDNYLPIIIASHRWGGIGWTADKRTLSSFNKLPSTKVGDKIVIQWGQREYEYEIYNTETSTVISDYDADLILYTCQVIWSSPERIFRYASRIN